MSRNSPVSLEAHDNFRDPPAEMAREGARRSSGTRRWSNGGGPTCPIAAGRISGPGSDAGFGPRMVKLCALVLIGVDEHGAERLLAVADGALGFWAALDQAYPHTRHRRCRLHKTGSILNVLPESVQPRAKQAAAADLDGLRPGMMPGRRSRASPTPAARNIRRPPRSCQRTATSCWPSTTFPPRTGRASAPPARSSRRYRRSGTAPSARGAA